MDIEGLRQEIDKIDADLVRVLNERAALVVQIGRLKRAASLPVVELNREHKIYETTARMNAGPLSAEDIHRIFERIIDVMRNIQRTEIKGRAETRAEIVPPADDLLD